MNKQNHNNKNKSKPKSKREIVEIKKERFEDDLIKLEERLKIETPPSGYVYKYDPNEKVIDSDPSKKAKVYFKELPISYKTSKALIENKFVKMTPIQRSVIPHALANREIIGASKTGSGKTLCYIIPVLEILYRSRWSKLDGLGALIIVPTRELALQVFEVLKLIGKYHDLSGGLVIGGHNVEAEKGNIYKMNILIGTPGRLLQHFSETAYFNCDNLKLLVVDEADRIMDEGFKDTLDEIFTYLPIYRTTFLFSATITKSLKSLVKMNLKSPEYITIHNIDSVMNDNSGSKELTLSNNTNNNNSNNITPINLLQYYSIIEPHEKVDTLYSFLNSHTNTKCIVFLSSTKQVRYFYEIFKRMKLKFNFFELYGRQKQEKRTYIFYNFLKKNNSVLFATDIASRGVDFPSVDWVIQLDCPDDMATYIHRVGRTARYKSKGNSLLFISQGEAKLVDELTSKSLVIKKIKINPTKIITLKPILRSILSENPAILHLAKKAISSYVKSVHLNTNKSYFDIKNINIEELSLSYGLMMTPELKIVKKSQNDLKNAFHITNYDEGKSEGGKKLSKLQKLKEKIKMKKLQKTEQLNQQNDANETKDKEESDEEIDEDNEDVEEDFLKLKRKNPDSLEEIIIAEEKDEYVFQHKNIANTNNIKDGSFIENVKQKLEKNKEESRIIQKQRIIDKHKNDRLRSKARDYEKHHLNQEENNQGEENVEMEERNDRMETTKLNDSTKRNDKINVIKKNETSKINLSEINNSSLENKSNLALKLIREKGLLK